MSDIKPSEPSWWFLNLILFPFGALVCLFAPPFFIAWVVHDNYRVWKLKRAERKKKAPEINPGPRQL